MGLFAHLIQLHLAIADRQFQVVAVARAAISGVNSGFRIRSISSAIPTSLVAVSVGFCGFIGSGPVVCLEL